MRAAWPAWPSEGRGHQQHPNPLARSTLGGPRLRREGLRRHAPRGPPPRRRGRARGRGAARARPRAVVRPCSAWSPAARLCSTRLPSALAPPASPPPEAGRSEAHPRRTAPRLRGGRRGGASRPGRRDRGGTSGRAQRRRRPWPLDGQIGWPFFFRRRGATRSQGMTPESCLRDRDRD